MTRKQDLNLEPLSTGVHSSLKQRHPQRHHRGRRASGETVRPASAGRSRQGKAFGEVACLAVNGRRHWPSGSNQKVLQCNRAPCRKTAITDRRPCSWARALKAVRGGVGAQPVHLFTETREGEKEVITKIKRRGKRVTGVLITGI
ncbi:hypothetical protein C0Q70_19135 [Pomacea canaliculata]|uniref:Uncharacterized protein n=1 Tax=Pomacea canaliculata TaxID=400727 RepID=A0A2T7NIG8_POMCA|nr:hypothetical protein C0Q70_19135 [Pomacea canaliculata]